MDSMHKDREAKIRVIVVDDEPLAIDALQVALADLADGEAEVVATCVDGVEAVEAIREHSPDLVFLDVQMPDLDGFDVIDRIGAENMPVVVFVTAYDVHALRAFEVHAVDYLLKPFDDERFEVALRHAVSRVRERRAGRLEGSLAAVLDKLSDSLSSSEEATGARIPPRPDTEPVTRFLVHERKRMWFVQAEDVDYFEAAGNYVELHVGSAKHLIRTTLAELDARLDPRRFARIHRSSIVNIDRVREVRPWGGGDYIAVLQDDRRLRISRTYRDNLLTTLG